MFFFSQGQPGISSIICFFGVRLLLDWMRLLCLWVRGLLPFSCCLLYKNTCATLNLGNYDIVYSILPSRSDIFRVLG